ncbi:hypothetical protein D9M72_223490 [compost metagenome]
MGTRVVVQRQLQRCRLAAAAPVGLGDAPGVDRGLVVVGDQVGEIRLLRVADLVQAVVARRARRQLQAVFVLRLRRRQHQLAIAVLEQVVALVQPRQLGKGAPVKDVILPGRGTRRQHGVQRLRQLAAHIEQVGELEGIGRAWAKALLQLRIDLERALVLAGALGQRGVALHDVARPGAVAQAFEEAHGLFRFAQAFVGGHHLIHRLQVRAARAVAQRGQVGAVVGQAGGEPHHSIPRALVVGGARIVEPALQGHGGLAVPFGHLGQPFAPDRLARQPAHRGLGHALRLVELAGRQEHAIGEVVVVGVERLVGWLRRCLRGRRNLARTQLAGSGQRFTQGQAARPVEEDKAALGPGLAGGDAAHLGLARGQRHVPGIARARRDLQQPLDIAAGLLRLVGRQRQLRQVAQHLRIVQQLAAVALGLCQRFIQQVA